MYKNTLLKDFIGYIILLIYAFILSMSDICFPGCKAINYSDGSIYQYLGYLILKGKIPYRDAFDHKGILLYFINALGYYINRQWGIWFINLLFMILILFFSYRILRIHLTRMISIVVCIIVYSDFPTDHWVWNTPDFFSVLFEMVVVYLIIKSLFAQKILSRMELLLIGCCISCGFWMKQTTMFPIYIFILFICMGEIIKKEYMKVLYYIFWLLLGFAAVSFSLIVYFVKNNALYEMIRDYFVFNIRYAQNDMPESVFEVFFTHINNSSIIIALIFAILYLGFSVKSNKNAKSTFEYIDVLYTSVVLGITILFISFFGRHYRQYYLMCYPMIIVIIGGSLNTVKDGINDLLITKNSIIHITKVQALTILSITISAVLLINYYGLYMQTKMEHKIKNDKVLVIENIKNICSEGDMISVVNSYDAGLYLMTGYDSATIYPYVQAMLFDDRMFIEDYNRQILNNHPKVIVWMNDKDENSFLNEDVMREYSLYSHILGYTLYVRSE